MIDTGAPASADPAVTVNELSDREAMGLPSGFVPRSLGDFVDAHPELRGSTVEALVAIAEDPSEPIARRLAAGSRLGIEGDPRINPLSPRMITIPAGALLMGTPTERVANVVREWSDVGVLSEWIEKETPRHVVQMTEFAIGAVPVTNTEYRSFLQATGHPWLPTSWHLGVYPWWASNHPVHGIRADDADAYAGWLSDATGRSFRVPAEREWEYAAAGSDGRQYPWGSDFRPEITNTVESGPLSTTPVGVYLEGASPFGVLDLGGNVEEWVADHYAPYPGAAVVHDDLSSAAGPYRVARGGSFARYGDLTRCARRHGYFPRPIYAIGFRLAESLRLDRR